MRKKMFLWMIIYVFFSALGLTLLKLGVSDGAGLSKTNGMITMKFKTILILGLVLYLTSFLISLFVISKCNLTYFYPICSGLIYVVVCLLGVLFLKEKLSVYSIIGIVCILGGITVMNLQPK